MAATTTKTPLTAALINSATLDSEIITSNQFSADSASPTAVNIYSVAQMIAKSERRRFISALNHHRTFECSADCNGCHISLGLHATDAFGSQWTHLLVISQNVNDALNA